MLVQHIAAGSKKASSMTARALLLCAGSTARQRSRPLRRRSVPQPPAGMRRGSCGTSCSRWPPRSSVWRLRCRYAAAAPGTMHCRGLAACCFVAQDVLSGIQRVPILMKDCSRPLQDALKPPAVGVPTWLNRGCVPVGGACQHRGGAAAGPALGRRRAAVGAGLPWPRGRHGGAPARGPPAAGRAGALHAEPAAARSQLPCLVVKLATGSPGSCRLERMHCQSLQHGKLPLWTLRQPSLPRSGGPSGARQDLAITSLRGENHALRAELSAQQQQLADVTMVARSGGGPHSRHGPASSFLSNKKNEDDTFDVEAAVLTGVGPEPVAPCCRLNMLVLQVHRDVMRTPDDMHDAPDRSANAAAPTFAVCRPQCIGLSKDVAQLCRRKPRVHATGWHRARRTAAAQRACCGGDGTPAGPAGCHPEPAARGQGARGAVHDLPAPCFRRVLRVFSPELVVYLKARTVQVKAASGNSGETQGSGHSMTLQSGRAMVPHRCCGTASADLRHRSVTLRL